MKRYFLFSNPPDPAVFNPSGQYHYVSLSVSGYICVVEEESVEVPSDWIELPKLLDSSPANLNGINTAPNAAPVSATGPNPAPLAGISPTDSTYKLVMKLVASGLRLFHP